VSSASRPPPDRGMSGSIAAVFSRGKSIHTNVRSEGSPWTEVGIDSVDVTRSSRGN
jgi:hypothetical protein